MDEETRLEFLKQSIALDKTTKQLGELMDIVQKLIELQKGGNNG